MSFPPIVDRELRVTARRRGTYWARVAIGLGAIVIFASIFIIESTLGLPQPKLGQHIFLGLSVLLIIYCLGSGRLSTVDCLSEEKREGTLGLLFLTDLKGHDVVLGKLAATSLRAFYGLLASLPVLAVPLLLGGVTYGEFWRMVLVLVNTFVFSLAIGIFCSALSRDAHRAAAANFGLLFLLAAALPVCAAWILILSASHPMVHELFFSCPVYSFCLAFDALYKAYRAHFWWSIGVVHGLTWLLVLLASRIVPRTWQDKPARTEQNRRRGMWRAWSYGNEAMLPAFRRRLLDENAFYWLAARVRRKPAHVWTFLGLLGIWWIWSWERAGSFLFDEATAITFGLALNSTLKLWVALEAGQRLAEDQKTGALELLLPTPLTVHDILRGQWLALRRQFLGPLLVVIAFEIFLMQTSARYSLRDYAQVHETWLAGIVMLVADMIALSWVAMRVALTARSPNRSVVDTIMRILVLPWVMFWGVIAIGSVWAAFWSATNWWPSWKFSLYLWVGLGILTDLSFGLTARWQLLNHFRQLATHRFASAPSFVSTSARSERAKVNLTASAPPKMARAEVQPKPQVSKKRKAVVLGVMMVISMIRPRLVLEQWGGSDDSAGSSLVLSRPDSLVELDYVRVPFYADPVAGSFSGILTSPGRFAGTSGHGMPSPPNGGSRQG